MKNIDNEDKNWYNTGYMVIDNEKIPVKHVRQIKSNTKHIGLQELCGAIKTECDTFLENEKRIHKDRYPDVDRKIFWINYLHCNFYDKNAERKCLVYDYEDCNQTRANRCKYAKMQAMEKRKGMAEHISFRWATKSKYGIIEFEEGYTPYARVELHDIDEDAFYFMYRIFKNKSQMTDQYGQPLGHDCVMFYRDNY